MDPNKPILEMFPHLKETIANGICPFCGKKIDVNSFRDALSLREFEISGICQVCQDDFFGNGED